MPPQRRASLGSAARANGNGTAKLSSSAAAKKTAQPAPPTTAPGAAANKPQRAPTPYERRVYALCSAIPKGRVATYGDMARALTPPSAARAVGQAMRRNPYAPEVPCHRVVAAAGTIGGFSGSWGVDTANVKRKCALLASEGVAVGADGSVPTAALLTAAELRALAAAAAAPGKQR